jgi:hypothetical protein
LKDFKDLPAACWVVSSTLKSGFLEVTSQVTNHREWSGCTTTLVFALEILIETALESDHILKKIGVHDDKGLGAFRFVFTGPSLVAAAFLGIKGVDEAVWLAILIRTGRNWLRRQRQGPGACE